MPRHVEAWMDGIALSSIGPVLIQQVYEDAPAIEVMEGERPGRAGLLMLSGKRNTLKVAIEAAIRERFDLSYRASVMESVAAWAVRGGWLELSNHPERRLHVKCTALPALGTVRDYTSTFRIEFTAYECPYWEDKTPSVITLTGTTGEGTIFVPGTAETPVDVLVTPTQGTLTSFSITTDYSFVSLDGLDVTDGDLSLSRNPLDGLAIIENGTSNMALRTANSSDDLIVSPGLAAVSFEADTPCDVRISVRGRWA